MKSTRLWKHLGVKMLTCLLLLLLVLLIENSSSSSNDCTNNHEIDSIRQEIGLLRDENKNQNIEISLLKGMIESQDKKIDKKIIKELDQRIKYVESSISNDHSQHSSEKRRLKRPYRLIPVAEKKRFDENTKKKNGNSIILNGNQKWSIFYGPPTNCSDLSRLGYTLNGYYLVKRVTDISNSSNLEAVYCAFKQLKGSFNLPTEETRIGLLKFLGGNNKSEPSRDRNFNSKRWSVTMNKTSTPRMANLINGLGKCFSISAGSGSDMSSGGNYLAQWDCDAKSKGQLWSWNETSLGSGDRHLCNGHGKCAGARADSPFSHADVVQWYYKDEKGQRYHFDYSSSRPGFYLINNDHGKCLSVRENTNRNDAFIYTNDCNSAEEGQIWKWIN